MTQGRLCAKEVASVAKESALVFPFLWMCCKLKDLKPDYKLLTLLRYPCILVSRASNSPLTWPTISLEYENISIVFPPIFWTIEIPTNKVSYSASLFVAKKSSRISQLWSFLEISKLAQLQILCDSSHHQCTPSRTKVLIGRLTQLIFHPCSASLLSLLMGFQQTRLLDRRGPNPWQRCEACIWYQKPLGLYPT